MFWNSLIKNDHVPQEANSVEAGPCRWDWMMLKQKTGCGLLGWGVSFCSLKRLELKKTVLCSRVKRALLDQLVFGIRVLADSALLIKRVSLLADCGQHSTLLGVWMVFMKQPLTWSSTIELFRLLLFSKPMVYKKSFTPRLYYLGQNICIHWYMDTSIKIVIGDNHTPWSGRFFSLSHP